MCTTPQPLFDMSKAQPIQAASSTPLFDMSKAQPINSGTGATDIPSDHWLSATGDVLEDLAKGFGKGAMQTATSVSRLLNKIPGVGETLAPSSGIEAARQ